MQERRFSGFKRGREAYFDRVKQKRAKKDINQIIESSLSEDGDILDLSSNYLTPDDASVMSDSFAKLKNITDLDLSFNDIRAEGLVHISNSISNLNKLETIDLFDNDITDKGASYFAETLNSTQHNIESVNFGSNLISYEGARHLLGLKGVTKLDLGGNNLGDKGAERIAQELENNRSLEELDIAGTGITDVGAKRIAKAMQKNKTLLNIELGGNDEISDKSFDEINLALANNRRLAAAKNVEPPSPRPQIKRQESYVDMVVSRSSSSSSMDLT